MIVFDKLSLRQKTVLLALAKRMMIADAKVVVEEDALFSLLQSELGQGILTPTQDVFGEIDVSVFDDTHSRMVLVLTLATMAFIDDNFHPSESSVLMKVTEQVGFSASDIAAVMDIAERQGILVRDATALFTRVGGG